MTTEHEVYSEPFVINYFDRARRMGEYIGGLHANIPFSDNPRRDALEDSAYVLAVLAGHVKDAGQVGDLVRGMVAGVGSQFCKVIGVQPDV